MTKEGVRRQPFRSWLVQSSGCGFAQLSVLYRGSRPVFEPPVAPTAVLVGRWRLVPRLLSYGTVSEFSEALGHLAMDLIIRIPPRFDKDADRRATASNTQATRGSNAGVDIRVNLVLRRERGWHFTPDREIAIAIGRFPGDADQHRQITAVACFREGLDRSLLERAIIRLFRPFHKFLLGPGNIQPEHGPG